jgi:predicted lipid-binding transport protein (Tim44 family)
MNPPPPAGLARTGSGFLGALLGILFAIVGFVVMVGALMLGLVVAIAALLWSLVRGRKPAPVRFEWRRHTARAWRPASGRPPMDEVVDIEVREIRDDRNRSENGQP